MVVGSDYSKKFKIYDKSFEQISFIENFHSPAIFRSYAADLVVLLTIMPCDSGISGYAQCKQYDQYDRCVMGIFNWCPGSIDKTKILNKV